VFGNRAQHRLTREAYGAAPDPLAGFKGVASRKGRSGKKGQGRDKMEKERESSITPPLP